MKMIKRTFVLMVILSYATCFSSCKKEKKLVLTNDELVHAMVEIYTVNAALNINDVTLRDSTSQLYFKKVAEITGKPIETIRSDFELLIQMPDSLLQIQSRALDTLRMLAEKMNTTTPISIGIN
jgi:hypothetical protein